MTILSKDGSLLPFDIEGLCGDQMQWHTEPSQQWRDGRTDTTPFPPLLRPLLPYLLHVAAGSFIRSAHPRLLDAEQEARSPRLTPTAGAAAAAAARHLRHVDSRGTANEGERLVQLVIVHSAQHTSEELRSVASSNATHTVAATCFPQSQLSPSPTPSCIPEDLEEALLFEFEADESSSLTPKQTTVTSSLLSAAASAGSLGPAGSLPSVLSGVRSVTKDSAGTHVLTENFTLHIEEVRRGQKVHTYLRIHAADVSCVSTLMAAGVDSLLSSTRAWAGAQQKPPGSPSSASTQKTAGLLSRAFCMCFTPDPCRSGRPAAIGRWLLMPSMCCVGWAC
jgi:hypothetical protein